MYCHETASVTKDIASFTGILNVEMQSTRTVDIGSDYIHGQYPRPLSEGYCFQIVPNYVHVSSIDTGVLELCNPYNFLKSAASVIQLTFAAVTLYETRGDQINKYVYAAFGLTMIPYDVMSFVNFIANMLTPDCPALYMVRSDIMSEVEARGANFDGTIGFVAVEERGEVENNMRVVDVTDTEPENTDMQESYLVTVSNTVETEKMTSSVVAKEPTIGSSSASDAAKLATVSSFGNYTRQLSMRAKFISIMRIVNLLVAVLVLVVPWILIGILTHFDPHHSTS